MNYLSSILKTKKRFYLLFLCLFVLSSLSSCNNDSTNTNGAATKATLLKEAEERVKKAEEKVKDPKLTEEERVKAQVELAQERLIKVEIEGDEAKKALAKKALAEAQEAQKAVEDVKAKAKAVEEAKTPEERVKAQDLLAEAQLAKTVALVKAAFSDAEVEVAEKAAKDKAVQDALAKAKEAVEDVKAKEKALKDAKTPEAKKAAKEALETALGTAVNPFEELNKALKEALQKKQNKQAQIK